MSLLVFQNGVYVYKSIPDKQSSYIIKNESQSLEFQEYIPYSNCLCKLDVSDPVKYINSGCITLSFDSSSMTVYRGKVQVSEHPLSQIATAHISFFGAYFGLYTSTILGPA